MSNKVQSTNADVQKVPAVKSNITPEAFALLRAQSMETVAEPEPKVEESGQEEVPDTEVDTEKEGVEAEVEDNTVAEEVGTEAEEETPEAEVPEVLSKDIDLDDIEALSVEDLDALKNKLGGKGTVARFAELTSKRKQAEERLTALETQMSQQQPKADPLAVKKTETNPYADIDNLEGLQAKAREIDEAIEWAEEVLDSNEDAGSDDSVAVIDQNDVTKGQVKKVLRDARKARKNHLPDQLAAIQAVEGRNSLKTQMNDAARKELSWLDGEDNDTRKQYEALKDSPVITAAIKATPDLEPYMDYMIAHASNSIYGRKEIPVSKSKPAVTAPSNPGSSVAATERPEGRSNKKVQASEAQFKKTGDPKDYIAFREAQFSNRKSI